MPTGAGNFNPNGRFAFNRSYAYRIAFDIAGYTVSQSSNIFHWTKVADPNEIWTITIRPNVYRWSSNTYTLDYVLSDFYYQLFPDPTIHPMPYRVDWATNNVYQKQTLIIGYDSVSFGVFSFFDLPPAPPTYWIAPPLP